MAPNPCHRRRAPPLPVTAEPQRLRVCHLTRRMLPVCRRRDCHSVFRMKLLQSVEREFSSIGAQELLKKLPSNLSFKWGSAEGKTDTTFTKRPSLAHDSMVCSRGNPRTALYTFLRRIAHSNCRSDELHAATHRFHNPWSCCDSKSRRVRQLSIELLTFLSADTDAVGIHRLRPDAPPGAGVRADSVWHQFCSTSL